MDLPRMQPPSGGFLMMPEDPDCPYPLKLLAIRELEEQIERIKQSIDWNRVRAEERGETDGESE